jgi:adenine/guanine phosphoribosyltransferase-like PRPP-binding protein
VALVKKPGNHKAVDAAVDQVVQRAADKAAAAVIGIAIGGAGAAIARRRGKRANRSYVKDLPREVGGSYSTT